MWLAWTENDSFLRVPSFFFLHKIKIWFKLFLCYIQYNTHKHTKVAFFCLRIKLKGLICIVHSSLYRKAEIRKGPSCTIMALHIFLSFMFKELGIILWVIWDDQIYDRGWSNLWRPKGFKIDLIKPELIWSLHNI